MRLTAPRSFEMPTGTGLVRVPLSGKSSRKWKSVCAPRTLAPSDFDFGKIKNEETRFLHETAARGALTYVPNSANPVKAAIRGLMSEWEPDNSPIGDMASYHKWVNLWNQGKGGHVI